MAAIRQLAAVMMMMAALLGGPVAVPDRRPGRDRRGSNPWRAFVRWLARRRLGHRRFAGAGGEQ